LKPTDVDQIGRVVRRSALVNVPSRLARRSASWPVAWCGHGVLSAVAGARELPDEGTSHYTKGHVPRDAARSARRPDRTYHSRCRHAVFIRLNEQSLPAVPRVGRLPAVDVLVVDDGSTDRTAAIATSAGAEVLSFGENRGLRAGIAAGYAYARDRGYAYAGRVVQTANTPSTSSRVFSPWSARWGGSASPRATAAEFRYRPNQPPVRHRVLRRAMKVALDRSFQDATSGMYAANARALPILARPYESGAPEVESLLRLRDAGLRVAEVPVHMRERASGESKLQGRRAIELVLTVAGTLVLYGFWRRARTGRR
jgi:hypothetical protein